MREEQGLRVPRTGSVTWVSRVQGAFQAGRSLEKGKGGWTRARVLQATTMAPKKDPHRVQGAAL